MNAAQILLVVAGGLYTLLGLAHGVLTLRDLVRPRTFTPTDVTVRHAMQAAEVAVAPGSNLWRAWLGFNLTHSLGLLLFAGILLMLGLDAAFADRPLATVGGAVVAALYVVLARRFFFPAPTVIAGLALGCVVASWAMA